MPKFEEIYTKETLKASKLLNFRNPRYDSLLSCFLIIKLKYISLLYLY